MKKWALSRADPLSLIIAADLNHSRIEYTDDHIWEIILGWNKPESLCAQTTFGLRAHWMRLYPVFEYKGIDYVNPADFYRPPSVKTFLSNYLLITFSPFLGINVEAEYWIPDSHVITGRFRFKNEGVLKESFGFELISMLSSLNSGEGMSVIPTDIAVYLQGQAANLAPVCYMAGGPKAGNKLLPSLAHTIELDSYGSRQLTWALASLNNPQASLELARKTIARPWDAEIASQELSHAARQIEITTGNTDWDAAFAMSQKTAANLFFPPSRQLPNPSFVLSRHPDQGYSQRGDGIDFSYQWNGQTALEAYYLVDYLLPGNLDLAEGLLRNFIHVQDERGFIDWKPGLAGQRTRQLAQPVLASMALKIDAYRENSLWMSDIYPSLLKFIQFWFSQEMDHDLDGYPEWRHLIQTGLPDSPMLNAWQPGSQGVDVSLLESPSLGAMLYKELASLIEIATRIQIDDDLDWLQEKASQLKASIESTWRPSANSYAYRDYTGHMNTRSEFHRTFKGKQKITLNRSFKTPQRIQIAVEFENENTRPLQASLIGLGIDNEEIVEKIGPGQLTWTSHSAVFTSKQLFSRINELQLIGLTGEDHATIHTIDYTLEDCSLLLPLWASIPNAHRAGKMVQKKITSHYLQKFGISTRPTSSKDQENISTFTHLTWNHFIGEGLLYYGYRDLTVNLIKNLMDGVIQSMKTHHGIKEQFDAFTGHASGEINSISGLAPIGLFLKTLGIRRITEQEIIIEGDNPFPFPVTIRYRGLVLTRHQHDTVITFHNGQTITISDPAPQRIFLG